MWSTVAILRLIFASVTAAYARSLADASDAEFHNNYETIVNEKKALL
jgi:hypothetical protein